MTIRLALLTLVYALPWLLRALAPEPADWCRSQWYETTVTTDGLCQVCAMPPVPDGCRAGCWACDGDWPEAGEDTQVWSEWWGADDGSAGAHLRIEPLWFNAWDRAPRPELQLECPAPDGSWGLCPESAPWWDRPSPREGI